MHPPSSMWVCTAAADATAAADDAAAAAAGKASFILHTSLPFSVSTHISSGKTSVWPILHVLISSAVAARCGLQPLGCGLQRPAAQSSAA